MIYSNENYKPDAFEPQEPQEQALEQEVSTHLFIPKQCLFFILGKVHVALRADL